MDQQPLAATDDDPGDDLDHEIQDEAEDGKTSSDSSPTEWKMT